MAKHREYVVYDHTGYRLGYVEADDKREAERKADRKYPGRQVAVAEYIEATGKYNR